MKHEHPSPVVLIGAAVVLVLMGALSALVWQDSRDDTVEIRFGDGEIRLETGQLN